jgi:phosphoserine phosphatase
LLTGRVAKPIVWGQQKAAAVQRLCAERGVDVGQSYFYADGNEDAALMRLVGHPRPVNPRAGLAALAATHGWPVLHVGAPGQRGPANALGHLPGLGRAAIDAAFGAVAARRDRRR